MFGLGKTEVAILAMLLGNGPVGVPPGPEDPLMMKCAPGECIFYSAWAGTEKPNGQSANAAEKMLADPEIQQFLTKSEQQLNALLTSVTEGNPEQAELLQTFVKTY